MKRRLLGVTIICVLGISLMLGTSSLGAQEITLSFWDRETAVTGPATEALIAGFEKENPNIHIEWRKVPYDQYDDLAKMAYLVGEGPDLGSVCSMYTTWELLEKGCIMDLTDWYREYGDRFPLAADPYIKSPGGVYCTIPLAMHTMKHIFYNVEILENYGIAVPMNSWGEFLEACETLKNQGVTPATMGAKEYAPCEHWWQMFLTETVGAAEINSMLYRKDPDKGPRWTDPGWIRSLKYFLELFQRGYISKEAVTIGWASSILPFTTGKVAFFFDGSWLAGMLPPEFNWGFFEFPHIIGELGYTRNDGVVAYMSQVQVASTAPRDAAFKFLEYWTRPENQKVRWEKVKEIPATIGAVDPKEFDPYTRACVEFAETCTGSYPWISAVLPPEVGLDALGNGYGSLITGETTIPELSEKLEEVHQRVLREE